MPLSQTTTATARASIGLPAERAEQIRSLADASGITTTALIESWINRAIAEGAPGAKPLTGYSAFRADEMIVVEIAGHILPMMDELVALLLSTILDGAAGTPNPPREFELATGKAVSLDLKVATLSIGRHGRGVVFVHTMKDTGEVAKFAAPSSYVSDLARQIRRALEGN